MYTKKARRRRRRGEDAAASACIGVHELHDAPELERLADMAIGHFVAIGQVGNGSGHPEHPIVRARRQRPAGRRPAPTRRRAAGVSAAWRRMSRPGERAVHADADAAVGVARAPARSRAAATRARTCAVVASPLASKVSAASGTAGRSAVRSMRSRSGPERRAAYCCDRLRRAAADAPRMPGEAARARVHRRDQLEAGGEVRGPRRPRDRDARLLRAAGAAPRGRGG